MREGGVREGAEGEGEERERVEAAERNGVSFEYLVRMTLG